MSTLTINIHPTPKQDEAWCYLEDDVTTELLFGGGAGGGKSRLICEWESKNCLRYPGSRWLLGRAVLKSLKESTLLTLFEVLTDWGMKAGEHYRFNQQDNIITFFNGSTIYLKDLATYPSDPNFDSLGSTEYTGAAIDEANQVSHRAKEVVRSRLRFRLADFDLIPKLVSSCNPAKNWVYSEFYQPAKNKTLPKGRAFVQALVTDNPHVSPHYIESLRSLTDRAMKERLLFGNWEYDDDPYTLFARDDLTDLFSNPVEPGTNRYLTCDVARFGRDKTVMVVWEGLVATEIHSMDKSSGPQVEEAVEGLRAKHGIPMSHVLLDEDGVGGNAVDHLRCKGFVNGSSAMQDPIQAKHTFKVNYANLKAQCYYTLADYVRNHRLLVAHDDSVIREAIIADLEQMKAKNTDKDSKLRVLTKEEVKEHYGKSPDFGDALMMRMFFELDPTPIPNIR
jgi:phage terminase large subunit